ncbi:hypothetical protein NL676_020888 [Syzygium grande]|nr:hypothetical protein NL676_020888 [Syzygium grande]
MVFLYVDMASGYDNEDSVLLENSSTLSSGLPGYLIERAEYDPKTDLLDQEFMLKGNFFLLEECWTYPSEADGPGSLCHC